MTDQDFNTLLKTAAKRHGHLCPSLYFGVISAFKALQEAARTEAKPIKATLHGRSKCIRDGVETVLETLPEKLELEILPDKKPTGIIISTSQQTTNGTFIKEKIKNKINQFNASLSTKDFQDKGVSYLQTLSTDDILEIKNLTDQN